MMSTDSPSPEPDARRAFSVTTRHRVRFADEDGNAITLIVRGSVDEIAALLDTINHRSNGDAAMEAR